MGFELGSLIRVYYLRETKIAKDLLLEYTGYTFSGTVGEGKGVSPSSEMVGEDEDHGITTVRFGEGSDKVKGDNLSGASSK